MLDDIVIVGRVSFKSSNHRSSILKWRPIPPDPMGAEMTYGPSRVPEAIIDAKLPTPRLERVEPELLGKTGRIIAGLVATWAYRPFG